MNRHLKCSPRPLVPSMSPPGIKRRSCGGDAEALRQYDLLRGGEGVA
jgi:hypothetical protein